MKTTRRWPAEWEPQSAILFAFPHEGTDWAPVLDEIIPHFVEYIKTVCAFQKAIVVCQNRSAVVNHFSPHLRNEITFLELPTNDTWARDFGPITVFENGQTILLDFTFNGWGNKFPANLDNQLTHSVFEQKTWRNAELHTLDFVLEGGSIESNGNGILLTTSQCLLSKERNPNYSKPEIDFFLAKKLGTDQILWLDHGNLEGDDTDAHIDTLARFVGENVIVYVKCDDPSDSHFEEFEKMEKQLHSFRNKEGKPFDLIPLPWPEARFASDGHRLPATYANFLIINQAVLVPMYQVEQDDEALLVFKEIFPNRQVIGLNCRSLIEQHGSLHCLAMQIPMF